MLVLIRERNEDDGQRVYGLSVWTDPETGYKTVYASSSGFRWTGERYEHIDDARILELQAESFDFAGMDRHFAPGSDGLDTSGFDPDKVGDETTGIGVRCATSPRSCSPFDSGP